MKRVGARRQQIARAQYEALADFRYTLRQFLRFSENAARAAGLRPQQHQTMPVIRGFPGRDRITIGDPSRWGKDLNWPS
ncbi:MAG: hypothetical protein KGJ60_09365 [Verrucomicrobiota bacterium]|nr:hypothetical protein [Verrucomicrobiota bacterium]